MNEEKEELSTEEKLQQAFELYEYDCEQWDSEILLDELERMYSLRDRIIEIILMMKTRIRKDMR